MLSYSAFVVPLVKAVQEQEREIEQLDATIARLRANKIARAGMRGGSVGTLGTLASALVGFVWLRRSKREAAQVQT
jgi:hypothetical protein